MGQWRKPNTKATTSIIQSVLKLLRILLHGSAPEIFTKWLQHEMSFMLQNKTVVLFRPRPWVGSTFIQQPIKVVGVGVGVGGHLGRRGRKQRESSPCLGGWQCLVDSFHCGINMIQDGNLSHLHFPPCSRAEGGLPRPLFNHWLCLLLSEDGSVLSICCLETPQTSE